jgi:hypothetical protein
MLKLALATLVVADANFAATYPALAAACCQLALGCCDGGPCCD